MSGDFDPRTQSFASGAWPMPGDRLDMKGLSIKAGDRELVHDVDIYIEPGQLVGLVGQSGCGKTLTARSLLGMVDIEPGVVRADLEIRVGGLSHRPWDGALGKNRRRRDKAFSGVRGNIVGYMPQHAREALDPMRTVGSQVGIAASLAWHGVSDPLPWLQRAGFSDPARVAGLYPHELSGGMAQRAVIAQTLARGSRFLLADEPTTGLDPTVQAEVLEELAALKTGGIGILLITHDLRILPDLADALLLMDSGTVVERTTPEALRTGELLSEAGQRLVDATRRVAGGRLG